MSWAGPRNRWCTGMLKIRVIDTYLKKLKENYTLIQYVGIAADETDRLKDKCYPLVEWGMTEKDCLAYCYAKGFDWGGLYRIFSRVSCWCCPLQGLNELRKLYRYFPDLWKRLEEWDENTWRSFRKDYSVRQLAVRFDFEKKWQAAGGNIRSRAFYSALRGELARLRIGGEAMPDIKTRDVVKGTVKTIDKSAVAAERMKDAYIRTKDKAEHGLYSADNSPNEYAADRITGGAESVTREARPSI